MPARGIPLETEKYVQNISGDIPEKKMGRITPLIIAICIFTICSCRTIKPEAPEVSTVPVPAIPKQISDIDIPITIDLKPYLTQAETSTPLEFKGENFPCEGIRYSYLFQRSPFDFTGTGNTINLKFEGRYKFNGAYCAKCAFNNCITPILTFSCGFAEPMKKISIGYSTSLKMLPDYHLKTTTALSSLKAIDHCNVTFVSVDVTDRVIKEIRDKLSGMSSSMDKNISSFDLKPYVEPYWNKLFKEVKLSDYSYLNINPESLRLSDLNFNGSALVFSIGLSCYPAICTESHERQPKRLPDLSISSPANGFNIYMDIKPSYDTINNQINAQVDGKEIKIGNKSIIINKVNLHGNGNNKLVMEIEFSGSKSGKIFLVGTPAYNAAKHELYVPDFTFDIHTQDKLLKAAGWLLNDAIASEFRSKAHYNISSLLDSAKTTLEQQLNSPIDNRIKMEGSIKDISIEHIYPLEEQLIIRVMINGNLSVLVEAK